MRKFKLPFPPNPNRHFSTTSPFTIISTLKSSSLRTGLQLHSLALKCGHLPSDLFLTNALTNFYSAHSSLPSAFHLFRSSPLRDSASYNIILSAYIRSHRLSCALHFFEHMPTFLKDRVSFTTVIMALSQSHQPIESLRVFDEMRVEGVSPNEVTFSSVLSAASQLRELLVGKALHGLALVSGFVGGVLVPTNLVHLYAICGDLKDSKAVFGVMLERNVVAWNVMLNGYCKFGLLEDARKVFEEIPEPDLVSWSTLIDGYLKKDQLEEAFVGYREMLSGCRARPNEVLLVDLISTCGRLSASREGRQLHGLALKVGLDSHCFLQATVIHFYGMCREVECSRMQFRLGDKANVSSWNALLASLLRNDMLDTARSLFDEMPEKDVVSWSTMIAGYAHGGERSGALAALHLFKEMIRDEAMQPNEITMVSVLSAVASSGLLEQGIWIHDFIKRNAILLNGNLAAALVDMYAKCGSIPEALQLFDEVKHKTSVCPWNAIICGLAMHGHADMALTLFNDLQKVTTIKPNSITFIGVMAACCHAGLLEIGKQHFESIRSTYGIEPNIKHYGCMVDLLGRAGKLEEAQNLIKSMPMEADVVIWGAMLAASRTHGNLEIGELAAERLARLEPKHGAGRVLLSNIYAGAGRWGDVFTVRKAMENTKMVRLPGSSGVF